MTTENGSSECLQMQLSELEMLQSTYCKPGEFAMDDPSVLADITSHLERRSCPVPTSRLQYAINLQVEEVKYEVCCAFPCDYPAVQPEIYVRSPGLSRECQHRLNEDLTAMVEDMERGELCVGIALQWLQENGPRYARRDADTPRMPEVQEPEQPSCGHLKRYWIYSHHIYNKAKRRHILEYAKELSITGFCLPGKPGIICAEGEAQNCVDFWHRVKQMSWKKIFCAKEESEDDVGVSSEKFCRFKTFEETSFESGAAGQCHHAHMDMGEFLKYLEQHNCRYAFKEYFGFDGKIASS